MKKKETKLFLPVLAQTGALSLSKIAATGDLTAACLFPPFQRRSERKTIRKPEPRAVHTTVLHNTVAGKNCPSTYEPKDHELDIASVLLESEAAKHKASLTS